MVLQKVIVRHEVFAETEVGDGNLEEEIEAGNSYTTNSYLI